MSQEYVRITVSTPVRKSNWLLIQLQYILILESVMLSSVKNMNI